MKELFLVFVGGGLGSIVRFSLGKWVNAFHNHHFPLGTLAVNIVACFALGVIIGLADHKQIISPLPASSGPLASVEGLAHSPLSATKHYTFYKTDLQPHSCSI